MPNLKVKCFRGGNLARVEEDVNKFCEDHLAVSIRFNPTLVTADDYGRTIYVETAIVEYVDGE